MASPAWMFAIVVSAACGGSHGTPAPISNGASSSSSPTPALVTDAPMDCTGTPEGSAPGNHDRYVFEANDHYGYKDGKGTVVIPPTLQMAYEFKPGGIAAVVDDHSHFAFIDAAGKTVARAYAFDNGPDYFQEGFARIVDDAGRIGFISDRGVIPDGLRPQFTKAESFCNGMAKVEANGTESFVDRTGAAVDPRHPPGDAKR